MQRRTFRSIASLFSALLLLAGGVTAAAQGTPAPARASRAANFAEGIRETVLPNGLRVLTKEVRSAPVVSFSVWYRVGSRNEHTGITGVSHLLEHLMFKGTKRYGLGEISRTLFVNGATFNASTYYDWTNYYQTLASDRLELAMQLEADRMVNSRIDKADLDSEMTVVRSELEGGENNPGRVLYHSVVATAFQAHPYQWPIIGWRTDVENVPRDAIYDYYKTYYGPNNATVVIVGDFETEKALALVRKHFGGLKKIPAPPEVYTQEPPQRGERRVEVRRAGSLPMASVAFRTPAAKSPDFYALDVLSMVLGSGRTSRLYQALVEKGLATSVDASAPSMRDPFLFFLNATARPGTTPEQLEKALLAEVERIKSEPITAEELARAKSQIEADFVFSTDSVTSQANQIGYWDMADTWRYLTTYLDRIRALTPEAVQKVAQTYFVEEGRTVGHFIPTSQGGVAGPPPREASARVEKPRRGDRPVPLPKPVRASASQRNVTRFKLDNGISVVVQENRSSPTFALRGSLPGGTVHEPKDKPGLAGITAAMLSRGTEGRNALQIATELESVGASLSASGGTLATDLTGRAQSKDFNRVMDLLADMLREPTFPDADLQRLKGQVLAGIEAAKTDPSSLAGRAFERAVYPEGSPLRPETLDEAAAGVRSITRQDVVDFYRSQYGPDRMILAVTGDVSAPQVREALQQRFGSWPRNPQAKPVPTLDVALGKADRISIAVPDKSETAIVWGHAGGLKRSDPDFYATQVLNLILGGGGALNSRLGNTIRDEQGLAYTVFSFFESDLYPGPFQVSLGTNPANADRAIRSLQEVVERVRTTGVTQREIDEAVSYLTGRFPQRLETNSGLAEVLWVAEFYNLGPDYIEKYGDYYRAVTLAQVNEAAKKHLHPDRAVLVVAGPQAGPEPAK
jgi:zinc protease